MFCKCFFSGVFHRFNYLIFKATGGRYYTSIITNKNEINDSIALPLKFQMCPVLLNNKVNCEHQVNLLVAVWDKLYLNE